MANQKPKADSQDKRKKPTRKTRRRNNPKREVEVDVLEDRINSADLPHVRTQSKAANDIYWYNRVTSLFNDLTNFPFNTITGDRILAESGQTFFMTADNQIKSGEFVNTAASIPGIMVIYLAPTFGAPTSQTDPINLAAQQQFALMRRKNNKISSYDRTDVMLVEGAMDDAYMLYEYLVRSLKTFGSYKTTNRYYPNTILEAMRMSPELLQEIANNLGMLDDFAYRLGSINIPDQFTFIRRHSWLFSNIYVDAPHERAQSYIFMPDGFHVYTETEGDGKPKLVYTSFEDLFGLKPGENITTIQQIQSAINKVMNPILGSQAIGEISADIENAFGESGLIKIAPASTYRAIEPAYVPEVLNQIANMTLFRTTAYDDLQNDLTVNVADLTAGPYLVCQPSFKKGLNNNLQMEQAYPTLRKYLINLMGEEPSPDTVMTSTRLMSVLDNGYEADRLLVRSCGTEIVRDVYMYNFTPSTAEDSWVIQKTRITQDFTNASTGLIASMLSFDYHPTMYHWTTDLGGKPLCDAVMQDYNVSTWLSWEDISKLNKVAVLSEFVPSDYNSQLM